ncbi:MAG: hypothetical protein ACXWQE_00080 [Bdellovibrionales bacterium]
MAFILNKRASYSWPVVFNFPVDGGKYEKQTFDIEFKNLSQSDIKEWLNSDRGDVEFCKFIVVGWKEIYSSQDQQLPFSQEALSDLLEIPKFAKNLAATYLESIDGAKVKN